jgi:hypothetical protein
MQVFDKRGASVAEPARLPSATARERGTVRAGERRVPLRRWFWLGVRGVGALSLLAVGAVHLQQYLYLYSAIPTIGTLFVLNFVGATVLGLGLLAPLERVLGRWGTAGVALLSLGGVALAATAFVFLLIAERTPVFGFQEPGYDPSAIMASRVAEVVTIALLASFAVARLVGRGRAGRW